MPSLERAESLMADASQLIIPKLESMVSGAGSTLYNELYKLLPDDGDLEDVYWDTERKTVINKDIHDVLCDQTLDVMKWDIINIYKSLDLINVYRLGYKLDMVVRVSPIEIQLSLYENREYCYTKPLEASNGHSFYGAHATVYEGDNVFNLKTLNRDNHYNEHRLIPEIGPGGTTFQIRHDNGICVMSIGLMD